jgi:homoserine kinase type II
MILFALGARHALRVQQRGVDAGAALRLQRVGIGQHLAARGIPVPAPQPATDGSLVHSVAGKPASVVTRLPGGHRLAPGVNHCVQVGRMLARMHTAGQSLPVSQPHLRGLSWWAETVPVVLPFLQPAQASLLVDELAFQQELAASPLGQTLHRGPIHADLFRDNVMFDDTAGPDTLCGFFDFYFAGTDWLLFDVAVCLNDWCCDLSTGALAEDRASAADRTRDARYRERVLGLSTQLESTSAGALNQRLSYGLDWSRTRITKDEFVRLGLAEDKEISFQIREYRVLSRDGFDLSPEVSAVHQLPSIAENI